MSRFSGSVETERKSQTEIHPTILKGEKKK